MRKSLAICALLLLSVAALAAENPDAPSATRANALQRSVALNTSAIASFDAKEWAEMVAPAPVKKKVIDKKFLALTGIATALTVADFEMTQHCLGNRSCVEADPLMPTSRAGMYASSAPVNAALYYWSYRLKAKGSRVWWLPTVAAIASHAVGVGTNIRFIK
jgi:hypothetical protein